MEARDRQPQRAAAVPIATREKQKEQPMNEDRLTGTAKNLGGKVEEGFGRATGDAKTQFEGKARQAEGALQDLYGQAKDTAADTVEIMRERASDVDDFLRTTIEQRPYTTAAVCLALGFFIGSLARRS
jgi:uncharacterized protein YjbJ (UPF0337 family)